MPGMALSATGDPETGGTPPLLWGTHGHLLVKHGQHRQCTEYPREGTDGGRAPSGLRARLAFSLQQTLYSNSTRHSTSCLDRSFSIFSFQSHTLCRVDVLTVALWVSAVDVPAENVTTLITHCNQSACLPSAQSPHASSAYSYSWPPGPGDCSEPAHQGRA